MAIARILVCFALVAAALAPPLAAAHGEKHVPKPPAAGAPAQMPWGIAGEASAATRTIEVRMTDAMRFIPDRIAVRRGETIHFRVRNDGRMMHEMVIGTKGVLDEHAEQMVKFPDMEHDAPYMTHVAPGKTGSIVWTFNRVGEFHFACLVAGHYQAGMVGRIKVAGAP